MCSSDLYYPITLDQQPALAGRSRISGDLGVAHALQEKVMSLPMHPYLDDATQDQVVAALRTGL